MPRWKEKMLTKENEMQEWKTINFKSQWLLINYSETVFFFNFCSNNRTIQEVHMVQPYPIAAFLHFYLFALLNVELWIVIFVIIIFASGKSEFRNIV